MLKVTKSGIMHRTSKPPCMLYRTDETGNRKKMVGKKG